MYRGLLHFTQTLTTRQNNKKIKKLGAKIIKMKTKKNKLKNIQNELVQPERLQEVRKWGRK